MKTNPGRYYAIPQGYERSALVKRGNTVIAEVFTDREPGDQYQTAALYAAAPALLAALQGLIGSLAKLKSGDYVVGRDSIWLDVARAAIANAKGGQP